MRKPVLTKVTGSLPFPYFSFNQTFSTCCYGYSHSNEVDFNLCTLACVIVFDICFLWLSVDCYSGLLWLFSNSPGKLRHTRSVAYSGELVVLNYNTWFPALRCHSRIRLRKRRVLTEFLRLNVILTYFCNGQRRYGNGGTDT